MRDFEWGDRLWAVIKADGTFAGVPCTSSDEARELANQHEGSQIFELSIVRQPSRVFYISCPLKEFDCPYYRNGECACENPMDECDDFYSAWGDADKSEYTNYNKIRTAFE